MVRRDPLDVGDFLTESSLWTKEQVSVNVPKFAAFGNRSQFTFALLLCSV